MKARVLVLDVLEGKGLYETEIATLDDIYKALGCDCFDIANRGIGNKRFDIFVDDEGLFREAPIVSALDESMRPMLVGNLLFANHDSAGETTSLSDEDIALIKACATRIIDFDAEPIREYDVIFPVRY